MHHDNIPQIDGAYVNSIESESELEDISVNTDTQERSINGDIVVDDQCARFFLTNAYSIMPKIKSLHDAFESLNLHFACLTEAWLKGGKLHNDRLTDLKGSTGIRLIHKNRPGNAIREAVAIAFDPGDM